MSGVISRGIKAPIIRKGDDLVEIVVDNVLAASKEDNFSVKDKDVIAITESIVARSQGNYIHVDTSYISLVPNLIFEYIICIR